MRNFVRAHWAIAVLMAVAMTATILPSCASLPGSGASPEQQYYAAKTTFVALLAITTVWAQSTAGQDQPKTLVKIQAVAARVNSIVEQVDLALCLQPPEPEPALDCIPLTGSAAEKRFQFASRALLIAVSELQLLQPAETEREDE